MEEDLSQPPSVAAEELRGRRTEREFAEIDRLTLSRTRGPAKLLDMFVTVTARPRSSRPGLPVPADSCRGLLADGFRP
jgi:hypothetical protein